MLRKLAEELQPQERWQPVCFVEDTNLHPDWATELHLRIQLIQDAISCGIHDNIDKWCKYLEYEMQWFAEKTISLEVREYIESVLESVKNYRK